MPLESPEEAYRDYYREVERYWSVKRGNQIIVSPLEFEAIQGWHQAGVPLAVVRRAIDVFIDKKKKAKRKRSFLLSHAGNDIEKVYREFQALHEGEAEEQEDLLDTKMKAILRKIRRIGKEHPTAAEFLEVLAEGLSAIDLKNAVRYEDIDQQLSAWETRLMAYFTAQLDEETLRAIREEVGEFLKEEEDPELYQRMVNDGVRAHFGLPRLTLLG